MKYRRLFIKLGLLLALIIVITALIFKYDLVKYFNKGCAEDYINSYGDFAGVIYILLFALRTLLVFFPFSVMIILGGSIFGLTNGFIFSMISIFVASNIAFFIGRYAGRDFVQKIMKGRIQKLNLKIEEHGFKIIFFMRLSVIFPFDILNYAAGLSKVKYKDFILGNMLGLIPEVFSLTYFGSNLEHPLSIKFMVGIVLIILTMAVPFIINKRKKII